MTRDKALLVLVALLALVSVVLLVTRPEERQFDQQEDARVEVAAIAVSGQALTDHDPAASDDPELGAKAPALSGRNALDETVLVAPGEDPPTLLVFISHGCEGCEQQVDRIIDWSRERSQPDGMRIVAVSTAASRTQVNWPPSQWLAQREWPYQTIYDDRAGTARAAYGVQGLPAFVLFGADGLVINRVTGLLAKDDLDELVEQALVSATQPDAQVVEDENAIEGGNSDPAPPEGDVQVDEPAPDEPSGASDAAAPGDDDEAPTADAEPLSPK